jgi:hypothetical protein
MRRLVLVLLLSACGGLPAPTLDAQRQVVETTQDFARIGWWRYLAGDASGAREAFGQAPADALASLGRAQLARDALDPSQVLIEAAHATTADGLVGAVARAWLAEAADQLRDGEKQSKNAPVRGPERTQVAPAHHSLRISFLPWLDLPRLVLTPPKLEAAPGSAGTITALGRTWALNTAAPRADVDGLVLTTWPLPADAPAPAVTLEVGGPAVVWRADATGALRIVAATDFTRHAGATLRFSAPGTGPLVAVWAAGEVPTLWLHPTPAGPGDDLPGPPVPERSAGTDWLFRYLAIEVALADGDAETAELRLADAPTTPAFALQRAQLAERQPGLPTAAARDEARAAWESAAAFAPARAHLALGLLAFRQGLPEEARRHLEAVLAQAPGAFAAHHAFMRLHLSEGRTDDAARSLDAARAAAPNPCRLVDDQAALASGRPGADALLIEAYLGCDRPLDAARRLLDQARPGDALALLDGLNPSKLKDKRARNAGPAAVGEAGAAGETKLEQPKDEVTHRVHSLFRLRKLRARALVGLGRLEEARAEHAAVDDLESGLAAADLTPAEGPEARGATEATLQALVQRFPTEHQALELAAAEPTRLGFGHLIEDSEAAIAAYRAERPQSGPAVRVLDHTALLFFPNSKSLRWVHEILAIRSREAAEEYGEIGLPDGARLVALYTRKEDGRRLFAEEVAEKDTLTLPDLESGDFVVASYLEPGDNGYLYESGYLSPRVFFRGVDLPIFRQRFEVFGLDAVPPTTQLLLGAPAPEPIKLNDRAGLRFEARRVPLLPPEGDTPAPGLWLPSVRVGHDVVLADDLAWLRDRALNKRRRTLRFDTWAAQTAGQGATLQRIRRIARAVREGIDDDAGLMEVDVSEALASGRGNRALVLSAALESLGIRHRLMVTRTQVHVPPGPFETVAEFAYPVLAIEVGDGEKGKEIVWLDPAPERAEPGFLPFTIVGGDALQVWPTPGPDTPAALPATRQVHDRRQVKLRLHWHADGTLTGDAEDRLEGQEAIVIGHHIARLEPDLRPRLIERLLVGVVGAAQVTALDDPTQQDPDGPLTLRYRFTARPGDQLPLGLYPVQPASSHASDSERSTPLAITLPTDQTVEIEMESDRPFVGTPFQGERNEGPHRFKVEVEQGEDSLQVRAHTVISGGLVQPGEYEAFAQWAREVEDHERIRLKRE